MGQIRAVLVDPEVTARLSLGKADEPPLAPSEALVRVSAISLNRGEVRPCPDGRAWLQSRLGPRGHG